MNTARKPIAPLPSAKIKNITRKIVQAWLPADLRDAFAEETERQKVEITQVIKWGIESWLLRRAPETAKRLGIVSAKEPK